MAQGFFGNRVIGWPVALLRIAMGILFLKDAYGKWSHFAEYSAPDGMRAYMIAHLDKAFLFYRGFLAFAADHYLVFAWLVALGILGSGIGLLLGFATRLSALVAAFMVFNFWFMKGSVFWDISSHDSLCILIFLMLMFTGAGRVLGIDYFLAKKHPNNVLW
ncbi:MAG: TQO small subunit DoxD [Gammaproteobacteria bacterium]